MRLLEHLRNRHLVILDSVLLASVLFVSYALRFEGLAFEYEAVYTGLIYGAISIPVALILFYRFGLYQRLWRYAGPADLERIVGAGAVVGAINIPLGALVLPALGVTPSRVPLSVLGLSWLLSIAVVTTPRWLMRVSRRRQGAWPPRRRREDARRVLIVGAGATGGMIAREMREKPELRAAPVGFVDDDPAKQRHHLGGLPVLGTLANLPELIAEHGIGEVVIAMPNAPGRRVRDVLEVARAAGVSTRTVPALFDILSGRKSVTALRPVEIEDLLRRDPVRTDLALVRSVARGATVLVTGAGGSIGSELCRQLAALSPARLLLLGHGENSIFAIAGELRRRFPDVPTTSIICDVRDRDRLHQVFTRWSPHVVFHAAAHKHVPLMEDNVPEAITGNILGTQNVASVAAETGVARFVLISSDKAVRPTNVMGATKRCAEQVVQEIARANNLNYVAVRFGNVLGSRGSVVPTFLEQIHAGGPVTITHPEMRRYFMTIPEAVQLVLQASAIGRGGEIFVLDMGEPVKIVDLASDLIRLSGLEVGADIDIQFSGLRPGEKLAEELFLDAEHVTPTDHPKILRASNVSLPTDIGAIRAELLASALAGEDDASLRSQLQKLVPDFMPTAVSPHSPVVSAPQRKGGAIAVGAPNR